MNTKKISCIVPTYNRPDFVVRTLEELKKQTVYDLLEIIVVDDGSVVEDLETSCAGLCDKYIRLDINSGSVSIPRAVGITHSTCEYIAPVDDDVFNYLDKFEVLLNAIEGTDAKLVYGDMKISDKEGQIGGSFIDNWDPTLPSGWGVDGSQYIYRSDVYEKVPLVFTRRACDWNTARAIKEEFPQDFIHVPQIVSHYYWWGGNRSGDPTTKENVIKPSLFKKYFNNEDNKYIIDFEDV